MKECGREKQVFSMIQRDNFLNIIEDGELRNLGGDAESSLKGSFLLDDGIEGLDGVGIFIAGEDLFEIDASRLPGNPWLFQPGWHGCRAGNGAAGFVRPHLQDRPGCVCIAGQIIGANGFLCLSQFSEEIVASRLR